jgi:hypothetical protein
MHSVMLHVQFMTLVSLFSFQVRINTGYMHVRFSVSVSVVMKYYVDNVGHSIVLYMYN